MVQCVSCVCPVCVLCVSSVFPVCALCVCPVCAKCVSCVCQVESQEWSQREPRNRLQRKWLKKTMSLALIRCQPTYLLNGGGIDSLPRSCTVGGAVGNAASNCQAAWGSLERDVARRRECVHCKELWQRHPTRCSYQPLLPTPINQQKTNHLFIPSSFIKLLQYAFIPMEHTLKRIMVWSWISSYCPGHLSPIGALTVSGSNWLRGDWHCIQ